MSKVKRCVQCGILKEEDAFRLYTYSRTNETPGRYRICKSCEAINTAYRKAKQTTVNTCNASMSEAYMKNSVIIQQTEKLYATLENHGLRVPTTIERHEETNKLEQLLAFYAAPEQLKSTIEVAPDVLPDELNSWLEADVQTWLDAGVSPEYLQETVYESLKAKYRPQTGVDRDSFLPVYDNTYKEALNSILRRFDDYEETCSITDKE